MRKKLVMITGGPGTGKSVMAEKIQQIIKGSVILSYDKIKEKNFDLYGFDNERQKQELNRFGLEEFYLSLRKSMWLSEFILTDYPFHQTHKERLQQLIQEYAYKANTIYLHGDTNTIYQRGIVRDHAGKRHAGHLVSCYHKEAFDCADISYDASIPFEGFCKMMEEKNYDIDLGKTISVDASILSSISYDAIASELLKGIN